MKLRLTQRCMSAVSVLLVLSFAPSLSGQTASTGALTGTVTDATGAVIASAIVTVTNAGTGQVRTATTGAGGVYRVNLLPPGSYNVQFASQGFQQDQVTGVDVNVTEARVVDSKLKVGASVESVDVSTSGETVQTSSATVGTVLGTQTVADLPLSTRNFTNLLSLSAGAAAAVNNANSLGKGSQAIAVNGSGTNSNTYQMDGVTINNSSTNQTTEGGSFGSMAIPNPDSIQEFKIQTSSYDAGYGRQSGANVNVVTKSGTNQFHGTLFEFFRNRVLNANDFFNKNSQLTQGQANRAQVFNQNQFGGTIGGPIIKSKLLTFISYQETKQKNGATPYGFQSGVRLPNLPTGDRSGAAFRTALGAMYCTQPTFGSIIGLGGVQVACDGSNINPVALNVLNLKLPNGNYYVPGATTNGPVTYSDPAIYNDHQGIGNFDYIISQNETLSGRYFFDTDPTNAPFSCGLGFPSPCVPGSSVFTEYGNQASSLRLTSILTQSLVNEVTAGYQRNAVRNNEGIPFTDSQIGMQPVQADYQFLSNMWFLPIASPVAMVLGGHPFFDQFERVNQFEIGDQISWSHGKHTLRAGFETERDQWNWKMPSLEIGSVQFAGFSDFLLGRGACPAGSFAPANLNIPGTCNINNPGTSNGTPVGNILGELNVTTRQQPGGNYHGYRMGSYDWFVSDDLKVTPRLTLNVGVRWEYFRNLSDAHGLETNIFLSKMSPNPGSSAATGSFAGYVVPANYKGPPLPAAVTQLGSNQVTSPPRRNNFAPRLGYTWLPFKTARFVLRGGGGFFYDRSGASSLIMSVQQSVPYAYTVPYFAQATLANPYDQTPLGWNAPFFANLTTGASSNSAQPILAENFGTPVVYAYNTQIQYEFIRNWTLELGYAGTRGVHQLQGNNDLPNVARLASASHPINGVTTNTTSNAFLRVPYLGIGPNDTETDTNADSHYNSLQTTVRKNFSHGFIMQAAYTWARAISTSGNYDVTQQRTVYALNSVYTPQRLSVFYSYELPYADGAGLTRKALGGWGLSGTTVVQDGHPLTITDSSGGSVYFGANTAEPAQYCNGAGPGNIATSGSLYDRVKAGLAGTGGYINKSTFIPAGGGTCMPNLGAGNTLSGNSGRGAILGPGQANWDMSLAKTTKVGGLRDSGSLLFRAEFFNIFNHPQFGNPNVSVGATLGQISSTTVNPRVIQFALKYQF
jgi:hypothetical protein